MRGPWEYEEPLCAEIGLELFFPEVSDSQSVRFARSVCGKCIHKNECAEWAIVTHENFGVWGGTVPRERQRLRKRRKKVA